MTDTPPPLRIVLLDMLDEYDVVEFTNPDTKVGAEFLRDAMTRILASADIVARDARIAALEAALDFAAGEGRRSSEGMPAHEWHSWRARWQEVRALLTAAGSSEPAP